MLNTHSVAKQRNNIHPAKCPNPSSTCQDVKASHLPCFSLHLCCIPLHLPSIFAASPCIFAASPCISPASPSIFAASPCIFPASLLHLPASLLHLPASLLHLPYLGPPPRQLQELKLSIRSKPWPRDKLGWPTITHIFCSER